MSRPDLRGWKPLRVHCGGLASCVPTRLEGMETVKTERDARLWDTSRPDLRGWKPRANESSPRCLMCPDPT